MNINALKKWREEHPEGVPSGPPRTPWQKWQDQDTRKTAINAMCWHCMGGSESETVGIRGAIASCTASPANPGTPCPLWHWRPYK